MSWEYMSFLAESDVMQSVSAARLLGIIVLLGLGAGFWWMRRQF